MTVFEIILLVFLLVCAVAAALTRRLLVSVIIYMGYSLVMSLILGAAAVAGPGHHRGGCGRGRDEPPVLRHPAQD